MVASERDHREPRLMGGAGGLRLRLRLKLHGCEGLGLLLEEPPRRGLDSLRSLDLVELGDRVDIGAVQDDEVARSRLVGGCVMDRVGVPAHLDDRRDGLSVAGVELADAKLAVASAATAEQTFDPALARDGSGARLGLVAQLAVSALGS